MGSLLVLAVCLEFCGHSLWGLTRCSLVSLKVETGTKREWEHWWGPLRGGGERGLEGETGDLLQISSRTPRVSSPRDKVAPAPRLQAELG